MPVISPTPAASWRVQARRWRKNNQGRAPVAEEQLALRNGALHCVLGLLSGVQQPPAQRRGLNHLVARSVVCRPTRGVRPVTAGAALTSPSRLCARSVTKHTSCALPVRSLGFRGLTVIVSTRLAMARRITQRSRSPSTRRSHRSGSHLPTSRRPPDLQSSSSRRRSSERWEPLQPRLPDAGMEATLLAVLASRKPSFTTFLADLGVQSCSDVRHLWPSGKDMLAAYETTCGALQSDQAFQLLLVYTLCASQAHLALNRCVKTLVDERVSVTPGRPVVTLEEAPQPLSQPKCRSVITTGLT